MESFITWLLGVLALPGIGLPAIFLVSFLSATLLPMGSEPALFGYVALNPHMFWPAIAVASVGNTAGGMLDWWMGFAARRGFVRLKARRRAHARAAALAGGSVATVTGEAIGGDDGGDGGAPGRRTEGKAPMNDHYHRWMRRFGPPLLLLSWLPVVGDPFCTLAGWLRLSWRTCLFYIAIGKTLRYITITYLMLRVPESFWQGIFAPFKHWLIG
ncbi:YqaA family protein [Pandoraea apista]|uniref:DedA family protein n=1 Tax=Pandoraea apista TaxID=93218 RepID=A0ABX9ZS99_9BURK|nr:VTT domain-containing protein [Pandoraea apista]PTD98863.1 DedA family protein [Pandoraea apista]RRJ34477.1 DedA family protein [Pandoraea apista]RRJ80715.1 DedA family protein [Pandoraea apista]RSD07733.1 DedA family protein [Pandoraea apista]RSD12218.1 DedA family protein [Pandoraea apista]